MLLTNPFEGWQKLLMSLSEGAKETTEKLNKFLPAEFHDNPVHWLTEARQRGFNPKRLDTIGAELRTLSIPWLFDLYEKIASDTKNRGHTAITFWNPTFLATWLAEHDHWPELETFVHQINLANEKR